MALSVDLSDRTCIVTGISRGGLGSGIASRFAEAGANVALVSRSDQDFARELAAQLGALGVCSEAFECGDLSAPSEVQGVFDRVVERFERIDTLVNNAGVQPVQVLTAMSSSEWDHVMTTNARSVFLTTQEAARRMEPGAAVVNIASIEGHQAARGHAHYCASKAAILMHTRSAAVAYADAGIRVNSVSPGLIDREGLATDWPEGVERWLSRAPLKRLGSSGDIGAACVFLASSLASFVTGADLVVDGGVSACPTW